MSDNRSKVEFGDFQTPAPLAQEVISVIGSLDAYNVVVEPTCGFGAFLKATLDHGLRASRLVGWEINPAYVQSANSELRSGFGLTEDVVSIQDFFQVDWPDIREQFGTSVLFVGNPPWVTNAELGKLYSKNLPEKQNFQDLTGMEAMTGKSNFDISEWMLIKLLDFISNTSSALAFLIKTSVARKLFTHITKNDLLVTDISVRVIDAAKHFNVAVDACLFQARGTNSKPRNYYCEVFQSLSEDRPSSVMGIQDGKLISDVSSYKDLAHIDCGSEFKWRSGVKHDASKVMEFSKRDDLFVNGFGEEVPLPLDYLYPMYKSSHISKSQVDAPAKYMLITQRKIGDATDHIKEDSPETWRYLMSHASQLDGRRSSIYKTSPRFAIFGVGEYSFSPWKIVISGLYKNIKFTKIGLAGGKPIVVDDTCYSIGFMSEEEADLVLRLLQSDVCKRFIQSIVFLDNKRPITVALLNRINLEQLAIELGEQVEYSRLFGLESKQVALI